MPQLHREHGARRREEDEMIKGLHHQGEAVWQGQIDAPSSSVPSLDVLATGSSERDIARRSIHDR